MRSTLLVLAVGGALTLTACSTSTEQVADTTPVPASSGIDEPLVSDPLVEPAAEPAQADPAKDVALTDCGYSAPDEFGVSQFRAEVSFKNNGPDAASYYVTVAFQAGTERISESYASVDTLGVGQTAVEDAPFFELTEVPDGVACQIIDVQRTTF